MASSRHHTLALTFLSHHVARRASEKRPCAWLRISNFRTPLPAGPGFPRVGRGTEGSGTALPLRVAVGEGGRPHFSATVSARPDFPRAGRCLVRGPGASPASASCGLLLRDDGPHFGMPADLTRRIDWVVRIISNRSAAGRVVLGVACSVMHPLTEIVVALTDHRTAIRSIQERSTYPNAGYRSGGADFGSNAPHKWGILRIALRA